MVCEEVGMPNDPLNVDATQPTFQKWRLAVKQAINLRVLLTQRRNYFQSVKVSSFCGFVNGRRSVQRRRRTASHPMVEDEKIRIR